MQFEQVQRLMREQDEQLIAQGREAGLRDGQVSEARRSVERVLSKRGLALTEAQRTMLAGCSDLGTLERWLDQAITAQSADDALR